jgi:hypothetical protein
LEGGGVTGACRIKAWLLPLVMNVTSLCHHVTTELQRYKRRLAVQLGETRHTSQVTRHTSQVTRHTSRARGHAPRVEVPVLVLVVQRRCERLVYTNAALCGYFKAPSSYEGANCEKVACVRGVSGGGGAPGCKCCAAAPAATASGFTMASVRCISKREG